jgi:hypothetical protein
VVGCLHWESVARAEARAQAGLGHQIVRHPGIFYPRQSLDRLMVLFLAVTNDHVHDHLLTDGVQRQARFSPAQPQYGLTLHFGGWAILTNFKFFFIVSIDE